MTGNGTFNLDAGGQSCGSCFIKLSTPSLNFVDWFAPYDQNGLNVNDFDLNSSGPLLLPGFNRLVGGGKSGILYVLDRGNMGHFQAGSNSQIVQNLQITFGDHLHGSPIYWESPVRGPLVYVWYEENYLEGFKLVNGLFASGIDPNTGLVVPTTRSTMKVPSGMPGGVLSLSANGTAAGSGIVWATAPYNADAHINIVAGIFRAFDASDLSIELWNSKQNAARDDFGDFAKFTPPTVANGKVYVATFSNQLLVYGLLGGSAPAPTVNSVAPGTGPTTGGTAVTISGTGFAPGATVSMGASAANGVSIVNSTTITATTSSHVAGAVGVTVINADAQSGTLASGFTYTTTAPAVNAVAPSAGPTTGGTAMTIAGTNFAGGATVSVGGSAATTVTVVNSTTITATTAAHAAGAVDVTVTNTDTQSGTLPGGFTYLGPAPTVNSVTPASGPTTGGTAVTITGTNFAAGATVSVGGDAATAVTVVNSTTIAATTPSHAAGAVNVTVTNADVQSGTLAGGFAYTASAPAPTVGSVAPSSGPTTGGTAVTITGTNFAPGATVSFGGSAATGVSVVNSTTITATTPAHAAGAVNITFTNADAQSGTLSSGFTYSAPIAISFVQVAEATPQVPSGTVQVTYTGAQTPGDLNIVAVGWNDTTATVQSVRDSAGNTYNVAIGPTSGTGLRQSIYYAKNIVGGTTTVTVTFSQPATYPDIRILEYRGISVLDVTAGASGSGTTSTSGSATTTAANELIFGANMVSTDTSGPGAGFTSRTITHIDSDIAEDRIVTVAGGYSASAPLGTSGNWVMQMATFKTASAPAPTVSTVAPSSGPIVGGTAVTITGANFVAGATVSFGGSAATGVSVVNSATITATTPAHAAGAVNVTVTNPDAQSGTLASSFTYTVPAPTVTSVAPSSGPIAGGTAVTITGANFVTGGTVSLGGSAATGVSVVNNTTITATTPAHAAGAVSVTVTNPDAQTGTLASGFTYLGPAPTVSNVAPASGPTTGGTAVTITGTNFAAGATVSVGGSPATGVSVVNSTTITTTTPAHAAGAVSVTVTNADAQTGTLASAFTYAAAAISFVKVAAATPQSPSGTVAVTYPGGQTAGDLNIVVVGWNDTTATVQSVLDSAGNVYTLAIGPTSGTRLRQSIYYAKNILGGNNTVTVTFSQPATYADIRVLEYRGVSTLDVRAGASGTGTSCNSGSATTTAANELIFGANTVSTDTKAPGTGFTSRIITYIDSDIAEDRIVNIAGTYSATATLGTSGNWVMQMVTFK